ncbi:MAG: 2,3,4,5-tetrahydropyridine-2,6-dicarboxylate N-succinyltransferase [Alphaproteobacteria bacterium]
MLKKTEEVETPPDYSEFESSIDAMWEQRDALTDKMKVLGKKTVDEIMTGLGKGFLRVSEKTAQGWVTHQWLKKAILLSFRMNDNMPVPGAPGGASWYDKLGTRFSGMDAKAFADAGFRAVPGCVVRPSAFIAPKAVLMPSFVNVGAYVGEGTMVDTWATVGSCAQIGKNCHISGGVGIGGVLEPLQANPVIIEDNCFIGARSEVAEGVIVEEGSVLSMGVYLGASTKIIDRETGEVFMGRVPAYSVVVAGTQPGKPLKDGTPGPNLYCAVIVKRVDEKTRSKTGINELLRD